MKLEFAIKKASSATIPPLYQVKSVEDVAKSHTINTASNTHAPSLMVGLSSVHPHQSSSLLSTRDLALSTVNSIAQVSLTADETIADLHQAPVLEAPISPLQKLNYRLLQFLCLIYFMMLINKKMNDMHDHPTSSTPTEPQDIAGS